MNILKYLQKNISAEGYKLAIYANRLDNLEKPYKEQLDILSAELSDRNPRMQEQWKKLTGETSNFFDMSDIEGAPLDWLRRFVDLDIMPPPELLVLISIQFDNYLLNGGDISLEKAFFDVSHGQYAKRPRNILFSMFHKILIENKGRSQEDVLSDLISNDIKGGRLFGSFEHLDDSEEKKSENFLRKYRRWKKKNHIADIK